MRSCEHSGFGVVSGIDRHVSILIVAAKSPMVALSNANDFGATIRCRARQRVIAHDKTLSHATTPCRSGCHHQPGGVHRVRLSFRIGWPRSIFASASSDSLSGAPSRIGGPPSSALVQHPACGDGQSTPIFRKWCTARAMFDPIASRIATYPISWFSVAIRMSMIRLAWISTARN